VVRKTVKKTNGQTGSKERKTVKTTSHFEGDIAYNIAHLVVRRRGTVLKKISRTVQLVV